MYTATRFAITLHNYTVYTTHELSLCTPCVLLCTPPVYPFVTLVYVLDHDCELRVGVEGDPIINH